MTETIIHCPQCGADIPVSRVLQEQIRHDLEARLRGEYQENLRKAAESARRQARKQAEDDLLEIREQLETQKRRAEEAEKRQAELRQRAKDLAEREARLGQEVERQVTERLRKEVEERLQQAVRETREKAEAEKHLLQEQLAQQREKVLESQKAELALRKEKQALEERAREMDLEVQRKVDAERLKLEKIVRERMETEQGLKIREKEKQIDDLRRALEEARRRSELGSQELQGEVLELDVQARLEAEFPFDRIEPVPKGMRGADVVQTVVDGRGEECGAIVWETKNTRAWQPAWLDKLKQDQRTLGAPVAVIVSVAMPDGIVGFSRIDGVWVADPRHWPALAAALREQLIQVAWARASAEGRDEKMAMLYDYLAGEEFRQRVETIVEAFQAMQEQIDKERRAMTRHWAQREKQLQRVIGSTTGMYGALQGIIGASLGRIPALELDEEDNRLEVIDKG